RALANSFRRRVFVSRASFAPAAVIVLAALEPIASAQNPILGHVVPDGAQSAEHLPRPINVIDTPSPVPRAIRFLSFDQIVNRIPDATRLRFETDIDEQLQCARGQIAASWITNGFVVSE